MAGTRGNAILKTSDVSLFHDGNKAVFGGREPFVLGDPFGETLPCDGGQGLPWCYWGHLSSWDCTWDSCDLGRKILKVFIFLV